jgi:DNA-binding SARP family transcriptional activator
MSRTKGLTREHLLNSLWPGMSKKKAHENLRTTVYRMRKAIGQANIKGVERDLIFTSHQGQYILLPNIAIESDMDSFDRHIKLADISGSESEKKNVLLQALDISRESYLPEIYDNWADEQRSILQEKRLNSIHKMIVIALHQDDHVTCSEYCKQYLKIEPLSEEITCILMENLKSLNQRSEIPKVFRNLEKALREDLKSAPTSETRDLFHALMK